jgi:uncharacterized BrkB/YihY/UPF0761 family membrane protein
MSLIRRAVISVAQFIAVFYVFLATIGCAISGKMLAENIARLNGSNTFAIWQAQNTGMWLGGIAGFLIAVMFTATFFVLVEIARNTRDRINIE